jgi:glycosyltransferase 2 family protein
MKNGHTGGVQLQSATATVQRVLRWLAIAATGIAFVLVFRKSWRDLDQVNIQLRPGLLIGGLIFSFVTVGTLPLCWNRLLAVFGAALPERAAVSVWWGAQAARYLPTGLVGFAARAVLAERRGVAKRITIATVVLELGQFLSWAALFAGIPGAFSPWANAALIAGGASGLTAMALIIRPNVAAKFRLPSANRSALALASGSYGLSIVVRLVRAPLVLAAIGGVAHGNYAAIIAVDCLAVVAGIIGFTPAGIGTREAVIVGLLEARLGLGTATALAASLRIWDLVVEGSWLVVAGGLMRGRTRRSEP